MAQLIKKLSTPLVGAMGYSVKKKPTVPSELPSCICTVQEGSSAKKNKGVYNGGGKKLTTQVKKKKTPLKKKDSLRTPIGRGRRAVFKIPGVLREFQLKFLTFVRGKTLSSKQAVIDPAWGWGGNC